jgi:hypothetical protein
MAESGEFDVLVSANDHSHWLIDGERALPTNIANDLLAATEGTDIFPCVITVTTADPPLEDLQWAREHDIPILKSSLPGLRALAARVNHQRRAPAERDVEPADRLEGDGDLAELESARVAAAYGIDYVRAERCPTADHAAEAAERLGYPVVVKIDNVSHKANIGGVALNLMSGEEARAAAHRMGGSVIVAEQASGGVEVLVGAVRDPQFGPVIVVGIGGGMTEALNLSASALAPIDHDGARELVRSLPALTRLLGGEPPACLTDAIVAVARMAAEHPEIAGIDINPLLVSPERAVALDCLIVLEGSEEHAND